jgi:hypothetical protein
MLEALRAVGRSDDSAEPILGAHGLTQYAVDELREIIKRENWVELTHEEA